MTDEPNANDRQVGGEHYQAAYQHWDWVTASTMPYIAGCASKYVARHRKKNGVEDLQKALHYIDKGAELKLAGGENATLDNLWKFAVANKLTAQEAEACYLISKGRWKEAREATKALLAEAS